MNKLRDKDLLIQFGEHLRMLRISKDLSIEELANEADMEISQIYRIEKGKINTTLSTLNSISKALEIELSKLLEFKG